MGNLVIVGGGITIDAAPGEGITSSFDTLDATEINGEVKNFDIEHPTKKGWRLRYSVLEGPERGMYIRGKVEGNGIITLPDYWENLVVENSITVQLTPIGNSCTHYVNSVSNSEITIGCACGEVNAYYVVFAERKHKNPLVVEYQIVS
jgi:hypothetical protein